MPPCGRLTGTPRSVLARRTVRIRAGHRRRALRQTPTPGWHGCPRPPRRHVPSSRPTTHEQVPERRRPSPGADHRRGRSTPRPPSNVPSPRRTSGRGPGGSSTRAGTDGTCKPRSNRRPWSGFASESATSSTSPTSVQFCAVTPRPRNVISHRPRSSAIDSASSARCSGYRRRPWRRRPGPNQAERFARISLVIGSEAGLRSGRRSSRRRLCGFRSCSR